ncbi:hypothetical protein HMI54_004381 [Coelomomyces lativittatus]|nr:hypothetical protein HMI54_004381 [Coelomomyces lativittatus]
MRIPRSNEVFYYDLESCIQTQKPKSNSEYPFKYENEAQFIDYSMNPVNDMILIWIRPSSSSLRTARFYSTFFNESKNLQSLYHSSRETSHLLTLLFVNIDSFRKWAQTLKDGILTQFLQTFYSVIQTEVQKLGGMVTSIQSDRVLCAFGLPVPSDDDAEKAIQCSLSLLDSLKVFFSQFQESQHLVEINLAARVTLTTGHAVASLCEFGNRVHYALVGDPVNLVSNLETVAHNYSSRLLLHKSTEQAAKQKYEFREIDLAMIPNTLEPSYVYDVVGLINVIADNDIRTCVICYELGLGEYRQRNFDAALTYFRKCKSLVDDGPSTLMIKRCQKACDNIQLVPFEWDGVWKWD